MKCLAVCPTYGRIPYLSKMLTCFERQTYDDKHLILINDDKNIDIRCDNKDVTVLNCRKKLLLSEKRNIGTAYGNHDLIFPWDDDDIYLPQRFENHLRVYTENPEIQAYRNYSAYVLYGDEFKVGSGTPNDISFLKKEWFRVGGYTTQTEQNEDSEFFNKISCLKKFDDENRDYVYIWSGVNYHNSNLVRNIRTTAYNQLKDMDLIGKKFWVTSDNSEYEKFIYLDQKYKQCPKNYKVYSYDGKIDVSNV